ncbi:L,D-transpeptidase [Mediterranea massiliensis]|uniref:L,D-transpeptidase n=1 Tax=Mediterranea massiliensis TaxID=1841865 RepID=UPI0025A36A39|nr:L,D-transpeptidase [Mediterranea massiliensis]MDM8337425.1 L,D-transpeptidase [Mediterranea massiliensis]
MGRIVLFVCLLSCLLAAGCNGGKEAKVSPSEFVAPLTDEAYADTQAVVPVPIPEALEIKPLTAEDILLTKDLLYDKYTLEDVYPYQDTVRSFKWDVMRKCLAFIENMQHDTVKWVVLQNYKNLNREAPLVRSYVRNAYKRVADTLGVERYQSVPLYLLTDTLTPERYGRDGTIAYLLGREGSFCRVLPATFEEEWLAPERYLKPLADSTLFHHVVFVDRRDQNICTLEWTGRGEWKIRSMNPATTGRHAPPYAQETPLGMYLIQQKKTRMVFLKDGSTATGGYAPYASRFTNGAYIHGVPVNVPRTAMIEYSWSLGTTPRSHMCVRNATSHSKFIFDWAPTEQALVVVIE